MGQQIVAPRLDVIETFSIRVFMGNRKQQFAVMRLQFRVAGIQILARNSLFSAAMLFFNKSKCITFIDQKTEIIHRVELQNPTNTSQTDIKKYFVPLNAKL